jgi:phage shock protein E
MGLLELLGLKPKVNFKEVYKNGALIIDVRTPAEYKQGNYKGSQNIPLDQISQKVNEIKKKKKAVIAVCRSGARSAQATSILNKSGIEAFNGGPWTSLNSKLD